MMTLDELVSGKVQFFRYRGGELWYRTQPGGFEFPVPIADTGDATFNTEDRAILFLRWIRKHRELIESVRVDLDPRTGRPVEKTE